MNRTRLLFDGLRHHARGHVAVGLGAAVGAAVLAGALLVGDSLRGSLRNRADRQLAGYDHAAVPGRFFREGLAKELPGEVDAVLLLQGTVTSGERRAGRVTVVGAGPGAFGHDVRRASGVRVSGSLARALDLKAGSKLTLAVQRPSAMPRSSPLVERTTEAATQSIDLVVAEVLAADDPADQFTLKPGPAAPMDLIVPLADLQRQIAQPAQANALLSRSQPLQPLQAELEKRLTLEDWGLRVTVAPKRKAYVSVETTRLILEPAVVEATREAFRDDLFQVAPTFVYLANTIAANGAEIPYSVVAAVEPKSPLNPTGIDFADDEIVLVDWNESPIKANPGDEVRLTYFKPEIEGRIEEATTAFRLKSVVPLEDATDDPDLTPPFPGITDKATIGQWDPPFPYDNTRIKPRDERYWTRHRATPKAYISLTTAKRIWGSRFGDATSVRITMRSATPHPWEPAVRTTLRERLDAKRGGFEFLPLREQAHAASRGSTDFGGLFLAFSFFLIAAALMLVGLLFRLGLERRSKEIGLLRAAGYPLSVVRRLLLWEGLIVSAVGAAFGLVLSVGFAYGMLRLLAELWPSGGVGSFLKLHVSPTSLVIGFVGAVLMSELAVWWAIRRLSRIEPSQLLKGVRSDAVTARSKWGPRVAVAALVLGIGTLAMAPFMPTGEPRAGTFFGGGAFLLTAGLAVVWTWLKRPGRAAVTTADGLALRNATRNPLRSLLTAGLLASAAFLLVAVESFRREPDADFRDKTGGSGGFPLLAETDSPVFTELTGETMQDDVEAVVQRRFQAAGRPAADREAEVERVRSEWAALTVHPFRVRAGDDASCLNLYQATRPRVLGAPDSLIDRGGFRFSATKAATPEEKANPWLLLRGGFGDMVPAFVEENTAMWQLKKGLGDTIDVPDEEGRPVRFVLVGFLKDSVFQSELVVGDAAFRRSFPRTEGFSYFLVDAPDPATAEKLLEENLSAYGLEATPTADRVAGYLAVQNTYLSTFQLLGGFGLVLGVVGLAVVLLRNVWERRSELALLRAMGYRLSRLNRLVFAENAALLLVGLAVGVVAALVSVLPHVAGAGSMPWGRLSLMLGGVLVVGLVAAALAVRASVRTPIVEGLRRE